MDVLEVEEEERISHRAETDHTSGRVDDMLDEDDVATRSRSSGSISQLPTNATLRLQPEGVTNCASTQLASNETEVVSRVTTAATATPRLGGDSHRDNEELAYAGDEFENSAATDTLDGIAPVDGPVRVAADTGDDTAFSPQLPPAATNVHAGADASDGRKRDIVGEGDVLLSEVLAAYHHDGTAGAAPSHNPSTHIGVYTSNSNEKASCVTGADDRLLEGTTDSINDLAQAARSAPVVVPVAATVSNRRAPGPPPRLSTITLFPMPAPIPASNAPSPPVPVPLFHHMPAEAGDTESEREGTNSPSVGHTQQSARSLPRPLTIPDPPHDREADAVAASGALSPPPSITATRNVDVCTQTEDRGDSGIHLAVTEVTSASSVRITPPRHHALEGNSKPAHSRGPARDTTGKTCKTTSTVSPSTSGRITLAASVSAPLLASTGSGSSRFGGKERVQYAAGGRAAGGLPTGSFKMHSEGIAGVGSNISPSAVRTHTNLNSVRTKRLSRRPPQSGSVVVAAADVTSSVSDVEGRSRSLSPARHLASSNLSPTVTLTLAEPALVGSSGASSGGIGSGSRVTLFAAASPSRMRSEFPPVRAVPVTVVAVPSPAPTNAILGTSAVVGDTSGTQSSGVLDLERVLERYSKGMHLLFSHYGGTQRKASIGATFDKLATHSLLINRAEFIKSCRVSKLAIRMQCGIVQQAGACNACNSESGLRYA